jgi:type II secretory pathway component PulK
MKTGMRRKKKSERGVALVLAILTLFILTVFGIGLLFTTTTEFQIAGAETTVNKAFYSADSGIQYGTQQAKLGQTLGPCTVSSISGYWCFTVPERNTGVSQRTLTVDVTPLKLIGFSLAPGNQLNIGSTPLYNVTYNFQSLASEAAPLNTQKTINVDVQVGPMPFTLPNK